VQVFGSGFAAGCGGHMEQEASRMKKSMYISIFAMALCVLMGTPAQAALFGPGSALEVYFNFDNNIVEQVNPAPGVGRDPVLVGPNAPRYTAGQFGQAADFQNSNGGGATVNDWAISLGSLNSIWYWNVLEQGASWSFSMWINNTAHADRALFGWQNYTTGTNVGLSVTNHYAQNINYGNGYAQGRVVMNPPMYDGQWHMYTVVGSGSQMLVYVDGNLWATKGNVLWGSSGYDTMIGGSGYGAYSGTGKIDDLGIWRRALSPAEITELFGAPVIPEPATMSLLAIGGLAALVRRRRK